MDDEEEEKVLLSFVQITNIQYLQLTLWQVLNWRESSVKPNLTSIPLVYAKDYRDKLYYTVGSNV